MKIGLIGYSGSGKTALSTLLSGKKVESFDPFQPAVVTVKLKDSRLERLVEIVKLKKVQAKLTEIWGEGGTDNAR